MRLGRGYVSASEWPGWMAWMGTYVRGYFRTLVGTYAHTVRRYAHTYCILSCVFGGFGVLLPATAL